MMQIIANNLKEKMCSSFESLLFILISFNASLKEFAHFWFWCFWAKFRTRELTTLEIVWFSVQSWNSHNRVDLDHKSRSSPKLYSLCLCARLRLLNFFFLFIIIPFITLSKYFTVLRLFKSHFSSKSLLISSTSEFL
jgi:hypothetical protein